MYRGGTKQILRCIAGLSFLFVLLTICSPASEGSITLYDPDVDAVASWNIANLPCRQHNDAHDGLDASSAGIRHDVLMKVPTGLMQYAGDYRFVFHTRDSHTINYRNHQNRWALNLNSALPRIGIAAWYLAGDDVDGQNFGQMAQTALFCMLNVNGKPGYLGFRPVSEPDQGGSGLMPSTEVGVEDAIRTLNALWPGTSNLKKSKNAIWIFYGHADDHGLEPRGWQGINDIRSDIEYDNNYKSIGLDAVYPNTTTKVFPSLSFLRLVFLGGCHTAGEIGDSEIQFETTIAYKFYSKGADSVIGFRGWTWWEDDHYIEYSDTLWTELSSGASVSVSNEHALKCIRDKRKYRRLLKKKPINTVVIPEYSTVSLDPPRYGQ